MTPHGRAMRERMKRARPWEENALRAGRGRTILGRKRSFIPIKGATYEQATGEKPPNFRGEFGGVRRTFLGRRRSR